MSMRTYTSHTGTRRTPQSEPIPGREAEMARNDAGGFVFTVDRWIQLDRFLILGTEGGTYYADASKHTKRNAKVVRDCIAADGPRVVRQVVAISDAGRAPKNTPALLVLAMCAKLGDEATRREAYQALPKVARIGTHLFQWAEAIKSMGGFSSGAQRAIARWYQEMAPGRLALQAVKYRQREGWSHRDLLRLAKPGAKGRRTERQPGTDAVLDYITKGLIPSEPVGDAGRLLWATNEAAALGTEPAGRDTTASMVNLITDYRLPRECIPTAYLNSPDVWAALLDNGGQGMPITALMRNLAKMSAIGLLKPMGAQVGAVTSMLGDGERLRKGRVHPLAALVAMNTYKRGRGVRGSLTWSPVAQVVDALDAAFYLCFGNVEPTNKRWLLALDVSGSMGGPEIAGLPGVTPRIGSAAMAMVTARTEAAHHFIGFTSGGVGRGVSLGSGGMWGQSTAVTPLAISPRQRLDDVVGYVSGMPFGGTDCALPMLYAAELGIEVDVFAVYTDSETWHGSVHPMQALRDYRQKTGIGAKLVVVGMTSSGFSIADPEDAGSMDVVGFDTAAPAVMADWARQ